jgi:hypothetical protein
MSKARSRRTNTVVRPSAMPILLMMVVAGGVAIGTSGAAAQEATSLSGLAFMSGCWKGDFEGGNAIEEFYTTPSENVMLGLSRFMRGGRTMQHEFSRITADSTGIFLLPFPGGSASEHVFRLTRLEDGLAVFEAPEHDFPKRIIYRRNADGSNTARIDGGEASDRAQEWPMRSVACHERS